MRPRLAAQRAPPPSAASSDRAAGHGPEAEAFGQGDAGEGHDQEAGRDQAQLARWPAPCASRGEPSASAPRPWLAMPAATARTARTGCTDVRRGEDPLATTLRALWPTPRTAAAVDGRPTPRIKIELLSETSIDVSRTAAAGIAVAALRLRAARRIVVLTGAGDLRGERRADLPRTGRPVAALPARRTWPLRKLLPAIRSSSGSGTRGGARRSRPCRPTPPTSPSPRWRTGRRSSCWPPRTSTAFTPPPAAGAWSSCTARSGSSGARRARTRAPDRRVPLAEVPPRCDCGALLRPGVVWFGEALSEEAVAAAFEAARAGRCRPRGRHLVARLSRGRFAAGGARGRAPSSSRSIRRPPL